MCDRFSRLVAQTCDGLSHIYGTDKAAFSCVDRRIGKNWSKGLTAATDARVARNAAAHRGRIYQRHLPPGEDKRERFRSDRTLPIGWSDEMAYIVGLTATDGCLYTGLRKINFKSSDRDLVETYLRVLGRTNPVKTRPTRTGGVVHFCEFGDAELYRWFQSIGLMPGKSLILGAIDVPDSVLGPCLRGLFEGDGHIQNFVHHPTVSTYPNYTYERLWTCFNSASRPHLVWIQERVLSAFGLTGRIQQQPRREGRHDMFRLQYGNGESPSLLRAMYPSAEVPKLERKWLIWNEYERRHGLR